MRTLCRNTLAILFLLTGPAGFAAPEAAAAAGFADPRTLTFPSLAYEIPRSERFTLPNGLAVHLIEDRTLPWIRMTAYLDAASLYEPADKTGLAALTGRMLRHGGIAGKRPDEVDADLDFMASSVVSSIGDEAATVSMKALTRHFRATLEIFAGVLTAPTFDEGRFRQAVNEFIETLRRQNDNPRELADRELRQAIYAGHPLGRHPTAETVGAVSRTDLVEFHRRWFHPDRAILAVAGDIGRRELEEALLDVFAKWPPGGNPAPQIAPPSPTEKPAVRHIQREIVQAAIRMGHLGIDKDNPDLYALRVMDFILGAGGFNSRLMRRVRSDEGLAYSVWSGFDIGRRFPGPFTAGTETRSATTGRTIGLMREIMTGMTRREVTAQELTLAKESIVNAFVFGFTDAERVVAQRARIEFFGYPAGYLEGYRDRIAAVTAADVLRVARTYLHPERMVTVVVGDAAGFDRPLSDFGPLRFTGESHR
jgi:predicted Zn-dependent peptidase